MPMPYMGLYYQGFDYTTVIRSGFGTGVLPQSGNKYASAIFHSPTFTLTKRSYAGANVVTEKDGTPMLTVFYPSSTVKSFDISSFYYGCALNVGQGAAAVPNACNIAVTGYTGPDNSVSSAKQVCAQQFQYNPSTSIGAQQQAFSGSLKSCFKNIQFAIVTFTPPGGQSALSADLALVRDDIKYMTYTCKEEAVRTG